MLVGAGHGPLTSLLSVILTLLSPHRLASTFIRRDRVQVRVTRRLNCLNAYDAVDNSLGLGHFSPVIWPNTGSIIFFYSDFGDGLGLESLVMTRIDPSDSDPWS